MYLLTPEEWLLVPKRRNDRVGCDWIRGNGVIESERGILL